MLELVNVTKKFNLTGAADDERTALDNITLQIEPGEFITIIGGNGSGKSTTLNVVSGTLIPEKGKVLLNGRDVTKLPEFKRAAYFGRVFQDPMKGTAADMSVLENLEVAYNRGRVHSPIKWGFSEEHKKYFIEELKRFDLGLEDRLNQKVGVMSGGQRQALTLLMATIRNKPSYRMMRRDYILFSGKPEDEAKKEFDDEFNLRKKAVMDVVMKTQSDSFAAKKVKREKTALAREEFKDNKEELSNALKGIKQEFVDSKKSRKELRSKAFEEFDTAIRSKFDLTKQILLLDEHTAALDPKTAKKVLELTDKVVRENQMTTLMVTHNMKDALTYGDRLIMFHLGHIILDVRGEEKKKLTVEKLLKMFENADKLAEQ